MTIVRFQHMSPSTYANTTPWGGYGLPHVQWIMHPIRAIYNLLTVWNTCPDQYAYGTRRPRHIGSIRRGGSMKVSWPEIPGSAHPISLSSITKILGGKYVIMQYYHFYQIFPWLKSRWESPYLKFIICKSSPGERPQTFFILPHISLIFPHLVTRIFTAAKFSSIIGHS